MARTAADNGRSRYSSAAHLTGWSIMRLGAWRGGGDAAWNWKSCVRSRLLSPGCCLDGCARQPLASVTPVRATAAATNCGLPTRQKT